MDRAVRWLPVLLALLLGACVFGAGIAQLGTAFFGREYVDAWGTQWFYWYAGRQVAEGQGFGHTDLFFYPWGKDVYLHTGGNVLDALMAWPVRALAGPVVGYNLFVLGIVATNILAMRHLLVRLGVEALAAGLGAVLFAFNPWVLHELRDGRPTQAMLGFVLLFFADYLSQDLRRWVPLRGGLWLALAGLTYWYNALFAGLAAGAVALVDLAFERSGRALVRRSLTGFTALVLVAPFALPMLRSDAVPGLLDVSRWTLTSWTPTTREGVDIGLYVFDPGSLSSGFYARKMDGGMAFLQQDSNVLVAQLLLGALGLVFAPSRARRIGLTLVVVSFLLATGPEIAGIPNVAYLAIARTSSIFQRLWWPSRALVIGQVGLGILGGFGFAALGRLGWRVPAAAAFAVSGWWLWDLHTTALVPMASWSADVPSAWRCLAAADDGAVIELPYAYNQAHLYYQTVHGRPLFGGMLEDNPVFAPPEHTAFRQDNSFVAVLIDQASTAWKRPVFDPWDRDHLHTMGYRWVVLDKQAYEDAGDAEGRIGVSPLLGRGPDVERSLGRLLGPPVWEDTRAAIYAPWGDGSPCPG